MEAYKFYLDFMKVQTKSPKTYPKEHASLRSKGQYPAPEASGRASVDSARYWGRTTVASLVQRCWHDAKEAAGAPFITQHNTFHDVL